METAAAKMAMLLSNKAAAMRAHNKTLKLDYVERWMSYFDAESARPFVTREQGFVLLDTYLSCAVDVLAQGGNGSCGRAMQDKFEEQCNQAAQTLVDLIPGVSVSTQGVSHGAVSEATAGGASALRRNMGSPVGERPAWEILWSELQFDCSENGQCAHPVACGAFGAVYKGTFRGKRVAIKLLQSTVGTSTEREFRREVAAMSRMQHHAIIRFCGAVIAGVDGAAQNAIVTELGETSLDSACAAARDDPSHPLHSIDARLKLLATLAEGLMYMHHSKPCIIHGDGKPSNVVIVSDEGQLVPKWIDFGLSHLKESIRNSQSQGGAAAPGFTVRYAAPEVITGDLVANDASRDIYSFGAMAYEVLTGTHPWVDMPNVTIMYNVCQTGDIAERYRITDRRLGIPQSVIDLIVRCTQRDKTKRPKAVDIFIALSTTKVVDPSIDSPLAKSGRTKLIKAAREGNADGVRKLLADGASVDAPDRDHANTPLHHAALCGAVDIADVLVAAGANLDAKNCGDCTPLHLAVQENKIDMIRFLLSKGASRDMVSKAGKTPLQLEQQKAVRNSAIIDLLSE